MVHRLMHEIIFNQKIGINPRGGVAQLARASRSYQTKHIYKEKNMNSNLKGTLTELKCKIYFLELGYMVSTPESPVRYDFILDTGDKLLKIQVKTSQNDGEKITFETCSSHITRGGFIKRDYKNEIDYFCTWSNNECYLIPVQDCGSNGKSLRIVPTKNGQVKNISFAKDYIAREVLCK